MISGNNKNNPAPVTQGGIAAPPSNRNAPAATQERQNLFKKSLDRQAGKMDDKKNPDAKEDAKKIMQHPQGGRLKDEREAGGERADAAMPVRSAAADLSVATAQQAQPGGEPLPAHLEKMAAAIQELAGRGLNAQFQLQLPMGAMSVESVILARDGAGRLAIQLHGQGQLPATIMNRVAADLAHRLKQKKLRIASVEFAQMQPGKLPGHPAKGQA
ncbi:hypothetical protein ACFOWX_11690 [Sphingorhabdus arenilitoris]|uniref:Flagellar hook-length control protein FliK n=1 Tax=Sphingorhabdus arenilitoris TaxID=1490041 RepID=A0ABV8RJJ7_9SPHN